MDILQQMNAINNKRCSRGHKWQANHYWNPRDERYCHLCEEICKEHEQFMTTHIHEMMHYKAPKKYEYFYTWTLNPRYKPDDLLQDIKKFIARKETIQLQEVIAVNEHNETNFHVHMYIRTGKPLKKDRIYSRHGHVNKQKMKGSREDCIAYMSKEHEPVFKTYLKK